MQREGPGKMASSLMSESKLLFHGEFLWPLLCRGSRGSWCAAPGAAVSRRPRSAGGGGERRGRGSALASSTMPGPSVPGLAAELPELESPFTGSLTQRPGGDDMWQSDKTQRGNRVPVSLRAEAICICTDEKLKFPKSI